ncbi:MAG: hypothetical protein M1820_007325 [Bogoriella megaspora]|nr:MAG: hypothetical protein M1820_007325 [Bogoriella megaspora]
MRAFLSLDIALFTIPFAYRAFAVPSSDTILPSACKTLASQAHAQLPAATPTFKPSIVYDCLQEVPINKTLAIQQIKWLEDFLQFHSTTAYLKDPPPTYEPAAVDLFSVLNNIKGKALSGQYVNEYDFELEVYNLFVAGRDGHLGFEPSLVGNFGIKRNVELVSVSSDGIQLPKIYFQADILAVVAGNVTFTPSAVSAIDGENVTEHLINLAFDQKYQDNDAQFNMLFPSPVVIAPATRPVFGHFSQSIFTHHNDSTSYTFENGSTITIVNTAYANVGLSFASGAELFKSFYLDSEAPSTNSLASPQSSSSSQVSLPGYPQPVTGAASIGGYATGYFPQDINDLAVLVIPSFAPSSFSEQLSFQSAIRTFLAACRANKKERLIIDIRQNVGGLTDIVYDAFGQLFPSEKPYSGTRVRAFDAANVVGQVLSNLPPGAVTQVAQQLAQSGGNLDTVPYFGPSYLQSNSYPFLSWADFYGPVEVHGDNFSHVGAYQLNDRTLTAPLTITGTGNSSLVPSQPFASENITLLTDGTCQSACAYFANLLLNQGNVSGVAIGGLPTLSPMAVIGGTQGGEVISVATIQQFISTTQTLAALSNNDSLISLVNRTLTPFLQPPPLRPVSLDTGANFNIRDNIAEGDESMTPLQFTRSKDADCRTFHTKGDLLNVTYTWERVARGIARGGKGLCINGTIARSGGSSHGGIDLLYSLIGPKLGAVGAPRTLSRHTKKYTKNSPKNTIF